MYTGTAPLGVCQLIGGYGASTKKLSEAFPDGVQEGISISNRPIDEC